MTAVILLLAMWQQPQWESIEAPVLVCDVTGCWGGGLPDCYDVNRHDIDCNAPGSTPRFLKRDRQMFGLSDARKNCIDKTGNFVLCMEEPIDVPAIQEDVEVGQKICNSMSKTWGTPIKGEIFFRCVYDGNGKWWYVAPWTCQDKSRILETAEDGKHWCRKVQP